MQIEKMNNNCLLPRKVYKSERIRNKSCRICGDQAAGVNYNVLTCESCKIFFYRNQAKLNTLECYLNDNCAISKRTRRECARCRLRKCFRLGMSTKNNSTTTTTTTTKSTIIQNQKNQNMYLDRYIQANVKNGIENKNKSFNFRFFLETKTKSDQMKPESADIKYLMHSHYYYRYHPQDNDNLTEHENTLIDHVCHSISAIFTDERQLPLVDGEATDIWFAVNFPAFYIRRIVRFCKTMTEFVRLPAADQLIILKAFFTEIMPLRLAFLWDPVRRGFPVIENEDGKRAIYVTTSIVKKFRDPTIGEAQRAFFVSMHTELENDCVIRDLFIAQHLFKPRNNLSCPELIRYYHAIYTRLIHRYLCHKYRDTDRALCKYRKIASLCEQFDFFRELSKPQFVEIQHERLAEELIEVFNLKRSMWLMNELRPSVIVPGDCKRNDSGFIN